MFLGGWRAPWPLSLIGHDELNHGWWPVLWFLGKIFVLLFTFIWLRGTLPRLRYDQFMRLGWKVLIPFSLIWLLIVAAFRELTNQGHTRVQTLAYVGIPVAAVVVIWTFVSESRANQAAADAELAELEAAAERETRAEAGVPSYPVPALTGAPAVEVTAISDSTEVLDG